MIMSPAGWRYNKRVVVLSLIYAACLLGAVYGFKHHLVSGAFAWIVAILPALPIIGIFAAIGLYLVEEQDEYVRMLMVRQTLSPSPSRSPSCSSSPSKTSSFLRQRKPEP